MSATTWQRVAFACFAAAVIVGAAGVYAITTLHRTSADGTVEATLDGCVRDFTTAGGDRTIRIENTTQHPLEIRLETADGGALAEIESLAPQRERAMDVRLGDGRYRFACLFEDTPAITSAPFTITGSGAQTGPAVAPLTVTDLTPPALAYDAWISARIGELISRTTVLRDTIARGEDARPAWIAAHHCYGTLGAAYGAFGDLAEAIDGSGDTGFHAIERGLWSSGDVLPLADRLVADVTTLSEQATHIDPLDLGLRAHEITEDTVQFELTGRSDFGSHTTGDTVVANIEGTQEVLSVLRPLLEPRYPATGDLDRKLTATADFARSGGNGRELNAKVSELAELLAPVAAICDIRRTR